ncbi:MAG TPA: hypothetical protein DEQ34_09620 [Balneolaceae bacterium]|nr:hypothetical protein [Balneolaceae bacterium]|tara:strand:- start:32030 stop:32446 length:417 start_codon:yes stop_codon:yes gene_type:complete
MDPLGSRVKQITNEIREYLEIKIDLVILNITERITLWIGQSVQKMFGYTILSVGLLFALIAFSLYLGDLLNNTSLGFLITSLPLLVIGLILAFSKPGVMARNIQRQFMDEVIRSLESEEETKPLELPENSTQDIEKRS